MNNLLSPEEVKRFLEIEEPDLQQFVQRGKLHAYKLGGAYLRFRKEEVLTLRQELTPDKKVSVSWLGRVRNFWRFNNFYILSLVLIALLFFVAIRF